MELTVAGAALELGVRRASSMSWTRSEEMDRARQVQACLLRHKHPKLNTIEIEVCSIPARDVGGDFYDFLDLGPGHLGLALGDISGKGVPAALMMASLRAILRSQNSAHRHSLVELLRSANSLYLECTDSHHFASLFLGDYDDRSRSLRYVNCGHNPPLLVHADWSVERLRPTATLLGLFEDWECATAEATLVPGDVLLLYTDGLTEAFNHAGAEFGESGLLVSLRACRHLPLPALARHLIGASLSFSSYERRDDLTLLVARPSPFGWCRADGGPVPRPPDR
jgi:sigma-B regulation protein RsbU (phosphoserine phosphatase)